MVRKGPVPRFSPFVGLRYDPAIPMDRVIAPPYDVVGTEERARLAARHLANAIHVELPVKDPRTGLDRYRSAALHFARWRQEGVIAPETGPAFYAYRMTEPTGASSTGVIGALEVDPEGSEILPHEQTVAKDTTDRLELLRACRANLSPIWGLSLTDGLTKSFEPEGPPTSHATDDDGVVHSLWVVDDPGVVEAVAAGVGASPVVIADGHHRYHTALEYRRERRGADGDAPGGYDAVMALVVELAEDQLSVGPIHRVLSEVDPRTDLAEAFGRWFDTVDAGPAEPAVVEAVAGSEALALVGRGQLWLLTPREETYAAAGSDLDSSLVALVTDEMPGVEVRYHHDWRSAVGALASGDGEAAVLLRPVTVAQIGEWAHARRRMPPKSTYFHPKPRTGMVYRPLEETPAGS